MSTLTGLTIGSWRLCPGCANAKHADHTTPCDCELEADPEEAA